MPYANTKRAFVHDFGPGAGNLTVEVPAGSLCHWHDENKLWYVMPGQVPLYAQHDANYRGIPVPVSNLKIQGS